MKRLFLILTLCSLLSCQKDTKYHPYSFYFWRTHLSLNELEYNTLQKSTLDKVFVRFLDVDKQNGKFIPLGVATKSESFRTRKQVVPVVFIRNRSFLQSTKSEISFLAKKVFEMVQQEYSNFGFSNFSELQIDCDWTKGTKKEYFAFLKELQSLSGKEISVTLRLHQVKFKKKTGIPPVQKVYLMCYSTSSPLKDTPQNSILDVTVSKNYLANVEEYPLKNITVALPIYSWGIVENHLGKHKLINGLSKLDLDNSNFEKITKNEAEILKDGFYFGVFLNAGFKIKIEETPDKNLDEVVRFLDAKLGNFDIVYYQLSRSFVENREFNR